MCPLLCPAPVCSPHWGLRTQSRVWSQMRPITPRSSHNVQTRNSSESKACAHASYETFRNITQSWETNKKFFYYISTLFLTRINIKHFSPHCTACRSLFMLPTIFHSLQCTVICQGRSRSGGLALVQFNPSQAGQGWAQGCLHLAERNPPHHSLSLCLSSLSQLLIFEWVSTL